MMVRAYTIATSVFILAGASPALAQVSFTKDGWTGEASLSANSTTGNSETSDLGAGFKFARDGEIWSQAGGLTYDYGETEGEETKNRFYGDYQLDRVLSDRTYAFGRGAYELDEFDGFDYRATIAGGMGYDVIVRENTTWSVQGGPGVQIDAIDDIFDENTGLLVTPGETQTNFAITGGSRFATALNERVQFTNDTDVTWTEDTTILFNSAALTSQLAGALSARLGFDVGHDTDPPEGTESTDTTTRISLVYTFGASDAE